MQLCCVELLSIRWTPSSIGSEKREIITGAVLPVQYCSTLYRNWEILIVRWDFADVVLAMVGTTDVYQDQDL